MFHVKQREADGFDRRLGSLIPRRRPPHDTEGTEGKECTEVSSFALAAVANCGLGLGSDF